MIIWSYFDYPHQIQFSSILLTFAFTSAWSGHGNILQLHINGRQHFASMLSRQISYILSEEKMKKNEDVSGWLKKRQSPMQNAVKNDANKCAISHIVAPDYLDCVKTLSC